MRFRDPFANTRRLIFSVHFDGWSKYRFCEPHEQRSFLRVSPLDGTRSLATSFSVSFFSLMNNISTWNNAAVLCRAAPRGETVDGQYCNDGELASLRYHGGRIRLYVAATGPWKSWIAVVETGGRIRSHHELQRGERFRWREGREPGGRNRRAVSTGKRNTAAWIKA